MFHVILRYYREDVNVGLKQSILIQYFIFKIIFVALEKLEWGAQFLQGVASARDILFI